MKFERTHVYNFEEALYGMRLPLMSHSKSDSTNYINKELKRNDKMYNQFY